VSYLRNKNLSERQKELQKLIDERLKNEESKINQRVYLWLSNNQYFVDNELFDFYFCVAQNLAAVEVLGASGDEILKAKIQLEHSARTYSEQVINNSHQMMQQLETQLSNVEKKQEDLQCKLVEVLEGITIEHQNLKTISTGLVNSTVVVLKKQQQLLIQTETANKNASISVMVAWIIPVITLLGCMAILLLKDSLL
jgi:hypothetical protein